jgi:hypothetical protein
MTPDAGAQQENASGMEDMRNDRRRILQMAAATAALGAAGRAAAQSGRAAPTKTVVSIQGAKFLINGEPTFKGRTFEGRSIEGLLFNSRMANAIIDDHNPTTRGTWAYPDGPWDPERNTSEFIAAFPEYRRHGMHMVAINLQGGSPRGYSWMQPWKFGGFEADGSVRPAYRERLLRVIRAADAQGMIVGLGLFYKEATKQLDGEKAVLAAVDNVTDLLVAAQARNVLMEIGNEVDLPGPVHPAWSIIQPTRCAELITRMQERSKGKLDTPAGRLLVAASTIRKPASSIIAASDYVLLHGNAMNTPDMLRTLIRDTRADPAFRGQPLLINEDDHFEFDKPVNNFRVAVEEGVGWGYFDYRQVRENMTFGFQSLPVDWTISSPRKKAFFELLKTITGS